MTSAWQVGDLVEIVWPPAEEAPSGRWRKYAGEVGRVVGAGKTYVRVDFGKGRWIIWPSEHVRCASVH